MTSPLSSFTVRGSAEVQESVDALPTTAFISSLTPYSTQTPQFLVDQSGVANGLITLPGTSGSFLTEAGKVMLQNSTSSTYHSSEGGSHGADTFGTEKVVLHAGTVGDSSGGGFFSETGNVVLQAGSVDAGCDGGFVSGTGKVLVQTEEGSDRGFLSQAGKVILQEGTAKETSNGAFLPGTIKMQLPVQPSAGEEGNEGGLISVAGKALLQTGPEEQSSNGDFLSGAEKIIIQTGEEDTDNGMSQGPLLYLDSATGLHVLVHHLPHSTPQQAGSQGGDGSEQQFVVVGALQSEEEQTGGAAVEPPTSTHLSPLVPLVPQQTEHQPLPSTHHQDSTTHVSVENMLQSHIMITAPAGSSSETDMAAHQIFEAHLEPPLDLHPSIQPQSSSKITHQQQQPLSTSTPLITLHHGANGGISSQINTHTLMECSETSVPTLQDPQLEPSDIEVKEEVLETDPHISLEEIIEKFANDSQDDINISSGVPVSSDSSFPSITVFKNASLDQPSPSQLQGSSQQTIINQYKMPSPGTVPQQDDKGLQYTTVQFIDSQHLRKTTHDLTPTMKHQSQSSYSVRSLSSLRGNSSESSSIRVKVLDCHQASILSQDAIIGSADDEDQIGVDEESLYEVVMTYRCKLCSQVFEEKPALLKHHRKVHKPGGAVKIRVMTSDRHVSSGQTLPRQPFLVKVSSGSHSPNITHQSGCIDQENEEPKKMKIFSCEFCSKDFLGVWDFQTHLNKDHPNERAKKSRRGPRHRHGHTDSYPTQPGLLVGHRKARTLSQDDTEESSDPIEVKKRRVRMPKTLHEQYWLQKQKLKPVCFEDVERSHRCPILPCKYKFSSEENLALHKECHSQSDMNDERGFTCSHCGHIFIKVRNKGKVVKWWMCQVHLWKAHSIDVDLLTCGICLVYKTCTSQRLLVHQKIHQDQREHICTVCGKEFRQHSQLLNHQVLHSSPGERPPWKQKGYCVECQRWFGDKKTLKTHISAVHLKLKPHSCPHCPYRCARKFDMTVHMRQHSGERPNKCELCGWQCRDHNVLRRHRTSHIDFKPFHCPHNHCKFETKEATYFKRHMSKRHPNTEAVYRCTLCSLETPEMKDYVRHVIGHEKELVSDAFKKRRVDIHSEGESSSGRNDGKSVTTGGTEDDILNSQTTTNIPQTHIFTIKLEETEPKNTTTTTKVTNVLPPKQVMIKKESTDVGSSVTSSTSKIPSGNEEATTNNKSGDEDEEEMDIRISWSSSISRNLGGWFVIRKHREQEGWGDAVESSGPGSRKSLAI
ncbi:hypothetical protein Pmani_019319 [Petrolisthes manimaculis]|uniref:C2H2-type domain-containing protein n=1 Tax=Petrolisthes manimaculis TaxID=1843537 RepID=A0AAE1PIQ8_9EUCA|nr:hypothetical protein Pmani_019319 [Petrolisthes manimaculis]